MNWGRFTGTVLLCLFATVWSWIGGSALGDPIFAGIVALCISIPLLLASYRSNRGRPLVATDGLLMGIAMGGEAIAILVVANVVINFGRPDLLFPAIAAVVALHFFPMAKAVSFPPYHLTAVALLVVAGLSLTVPSPIRIAVTGFGSAIVLWATVSFAIRAPKPVAAP
jgi:hypothetical protein